MTYTELLFFEQKRSDFSGVGIQMYAVEILFHLRIEIFVSEQFVDFSVHIARLSDKPADFMIDGKAHIAEFLIVNVFDNDDGLPARNHFHERRRSRFDDGAIAYFNKFVKVIDKTEHVQIELGIRTSEKFERVFKRSVASAYDGDRKRRTVQHALFNNFDRAGKPSPPPTSSTIFLSVVKPCFAFIASISSFVGSGIRYFSFIKNGTTVTFCSATPQTSTAWRFACSENTKNF